MAIIDPNAPRQQRPQPDFYSPTMPKKYNISYDGEGNASWNGQIIGNMFTDGVGKEINEIEFLEKWAADNGVNITPNKEWVQRYDPDNWKGNQLLQQPRQPRPTGVRQPVKPVNPAPPPQLGQLQQPATPISRQPMLQKPTGNQLAPRQAPPTILPDNIRTPAPAQTNFPIENNQPWGLRGRRA